MVYICIKLTFMENNKEFFFELTDEHMKYFSDDKYLPEHYKLMKVDLPFYQGDGIHSVSMLQNICNQFKEYCHQQSIIKQNLMIELIKSKNIPQHDNKQIADLNHICINSALNITALAMDNNDIQDECNNIIEAVKTFTKHYENIKGA